LKRGLNSYVRHLKSLFTTCAAEELSHEDLFYRTICVVAGVYFLYFVETVLEMVGLGHAHSHDIAPVSGAGMRKRSTAPQDFIRCGDDLMTCAVVNLG
jgi:hypothetical protein